MKNVLKKTLIAGAAAAAMTAGLALVPSAANAGAFGYNYTHGYDEQGDPIYGGGYYEPDVGVGPNYYAPRADYDTGYGYPGPSFYRRDF